MKYISHIHFNGLIKHATKELDSQIIESLSRDIEKVLKKYNISYQGYEMLTLHKDKYSITSCEKCKNLMINRDKNPIGIEEECFFNMLYNGGSVEERQLCEMCLPEDHRWA